MNLSSTLLSFGNTGVGSNATKHLIIKNSGSNDLNISGISLNDAGSVYSIIGFPGSLVLKPKDSTDIKIQFSPKAAISYKASLIINPANTNGDSITVNLTGAGTNKKPLIKVNVQEINFGTVKTGKAKDSTFTIINKGDTTLSISYLTIANDVSGVFSTDLIGILKIEPNDSVSYDIKFIPKDAVHYTAKLAVGSNDSSNSQLIINLLGDGELGSSVGITPEDDDILKIIPNPVSTNSVILINSTGTSVIDMDIYNLSGEKVQNIVNNLYLPDGMQTINLNSCNLPCGTYFLKLKEANRIYTRKFVIQ